MHHWSEQPDVLKELSPSLMVSLIGSPDLVGAETEFKIYTLIRLWLYLRIGQSLQGNQEDVLLQSRKFFMVRILYSEDLNN